MPAPSSPITVDTARRLTAYNAQVFARYVRAARRLPWRVASANRGTGHLSIFRTLVHILNVHEVWMLYIVQGRMGEIKDLFLQTARKPTSWEGFEPYAQRVWAGLDDYVATLTPSELSKSVKAPWMPGRYTTGDAGTAVDVRTGPSSGRDHRGLLAAGRRAPGDDMDRRQSRA